MRATAAAVFVLAAFSLGACNKESTTSGREAPGGPRATPGAVTFARARHAIGERFIDTVTTSMKESDGEPIDSESRLVMQVEVRATDGGSIDSVAVTYAEESDIDRKAGKGRRGPMHGKTFSVGLVAGELEVLEAGADAGVSPGELGRLRSDWAWLGKPSPWRAAAGGTTLKFQEHSLPVARAVADLMNAGWPESTATASARYTGVDGGVAGFDVSVDQQMGSSSARRSKSTLTGTLMLRVASGELQSLHLSGPVVFFEGDVRVGAAQLEMAARRRLAEDVGRGP